MDGVVGRDFDCRRLLNFADRLGLLAARVEAATVEQVGQGGHLAAPYAQGRLYKAKHTVQNFWKKDLAQCLTCQEL